MAKRMVRVYNTTHLIQPPTGYMLDFSGKMFAPGRNPIDIEVDGNSLPDPLNMWQSEGKIRVLDAESGEGVGVDAKTQPVLTAGSRVKEGAASDYHDDFEEDDIGFDPTEAREAALPNGAHSPSLQQQQQPESRARVTLSTQEEKNDTSGLSPIPGDRPRSVDDSDKFTIRAPRSKEQGGVIGRA